MADVNERAKEAVGQGIGVHWRYQPVTLRTVGGEIFLCEVYFDDAGKLKGWTGYPPRGIEGDDLNDVKRDLVNRLVDCIRWAPVPFEDLHVGMEFTPLVDGDMETVLRTVLKSNTGLVD